MSMGWRETGIPVLETHHQQFPIPHRSRWRLTGHRGENCVWMRVRVTKRETRQRAALAALGIGPNSVDEGEPPKHV